MKPTKEYNGRSRIRMFNCDCMDLMKSKPENYWQLSIVDPPYGIDASKMNLGFSNSSKIEKKEWDNNAPTQQYFDALFKVSVNQMIWGMNYFELPQTRGFVVWDKGPSMRGRSFAEAELCYISFDSSARIFTKCAVNGLEKKIHKTQKPVQLYKWLLTNYAKEGDTILDTHGGSMSIAIACWDLGFDLDICELDTDYFNDAVKRFENHVAQTQLF